MTALLRTSQNPETSPGDLMRLAVSNSSEKSSANTDMKNSKGVNNNYNNNNNNIMNPGQKWRTAYSDTSNEDVQPGYRNRTWLLEVCNAHNEK